MRTKIPEIEKIKEAFDKVITYSQGIENPKTDKLFEIWQKAKGIYLQRWHDYIYEYPERVSFELDDRSKRERVMNFVNDLEERYEYYDLARFVFEQESGFFNNLTVSDYLTENGKKIQKGTKLVRAFKYFAEGRVLEDIQNEASRIIQENKIEGTLCLSVHPLDFLSLSENTHKWRSCHALDGEYRAGNLSYMMDSCTIICYLKSDEDTILPSFPADVPWNNKKWRVLLFKSDDGNMVIAGRQYPFATQAGMDMLLEKVLPQVYLGPTSNQHSWSGWSNCLIDKVKLNDGFNVYLNGSYLPINNSLKNIRDVVHNEEGSKHFNDVLNSSFYKPIYAVKYIRPFFDDIPDKILCSHPDTTHFHMGAYTYCLNCGEEECMDSADTMMCYHCECEYGKNESDLFATCACCSRTMLYDDMYFVEEENVCPVCYDAYCIECEECGEFYFKESVKYHEPTNQYVCKNCFNKLEE